MVKIIGEHVGNNLLNCSGTDFPGSTFSNFIFKHIVCVCIYVFLRKEICISNKIVPLIKKIVHIQPQTSYTGLHFVALMLTFCGICNLDLHYCISFI